MNSRMTPQSHHSIPALVPPANCFTILVIDDMPANRVLLGKLLKQAGYAVLEAGNGVEALALLDDRTLLPHLIITDIEMPEMDGITLVKQIRRSEDPLAGIPIIAASGNADESMRREAQAAGCDQFVAKPFDPQELRREIALLIRTRRQTAPARGGISPEAPSANRIEIRLREAK